MRSEKFFQSKTALITLVAASLVVIISLGVRQTFGLFYLDFSKDLDISITHFGFAIGFIALNGCCIFLGDKQIQSKLPL